MGQLPELMPVPVVRARAILCDTRLSRDGLKKLLPPDILVIGESAAPEEAFRNGRPQLPDIAIVAGRIGTVTCGDLVRDIVRFSVNVRTIVLATDVTEHLVLDALRAGAFAFLSRNEPASAVTDAINAVIEGRGYLCPAAAAVIVRFVQRGKDPPGLTPRERQMMILVCEGLRNKEIADRMGISIQSIRSYRKMLMRKLGVSSSIEIVRAAISMGIVPKGLDV